MAADREQNYVRALAHQGRRELLRTVADRERPVSPSELAREYDLECSYASYHCRVLEEAGMVKFHHMEAVRGASKRFYVANGAAMQHPLVKGILAAT